jgi:hypothetical protein
VTPLAPAPEATLGGVMCKYAPGARLYVMNLAAAYPGYADERIGALAGKYQLPFGSCAAIDTAHGPWSGPSGSGQVACMQYDGRPWIYFTFGSGAYLAFATRDDQDSAALHAWWDQLRTFLP